MSINKIILYLNEFKLTVDSGDSDDSNSIIHAI